MLKSISMRCSAARLMSVLRTEDQGHTKYIVMDSPKTLNALSYEMMLSLKQEVETISHKHRCVVIKSSSKHFSAGHNLKEFQFEEKDDSKASIVFELCSNLMKTIREAPVPVIALVNGAAYAAGFQLASSCDVLFATRQAKFALPGIKLGLFCTTPAVPVTRVLPKKLTFEMLCTGDPITADVALQHGLVNKVADSNEELEKICDEFVGKIVGHSREVIALGKAEFYNQSSKATEEEAYESASRVMTENALKEQCQEGVSAFFEKRVPKFSS